MPKVTQTVRSGTVKSRGRWVCPQPFPPPPHTLLLQCALELRGGREAKAEKGVGCTRERHIRDSAQSWRPEPGKASKAQGEPCVCLATDDRAEALVPSRPTLPGPPL